MVKNALNYSGLPQDDNEKQINSPKIFFPGRKSPQAAVAASRDCKLCALLLFLTVVVGGTLAIVLPLTLPKRQVEKAHPPSPPPLSGIPNDVNDEPPGKMSAENETRANDNVSDASGSINASFSIPISESSPLSETPTNETGNVSLTRPNSNETEPFPSTPDNRSKNESSIPKNEARPFGITEAPAPHLTVDESENEFSNATFISQIINKILQSKHFESGLLNDSVIRTWIKNVASEPSVEVAILGAVASFLGLLLLTISIACLISSRRIVRNRRLKIKDVVTDLQAPDKVVLLTSDLSEEEA